MNDDNPTFDAALEAWSQATQFDPDDAEQFDAGETIRTVASAAADQIEIDAAIERLPRLRSDRDDVPFPDVQYLGPLGEGGMGTVELAVQIPVGREVAAKKVRPAEAIGTADRDEALQNLLREAWITGYLEHPNIVPIYRVGCNADDEPIIVMKRIEGVSWQGVLDDPATAPSEIEEDPLAWHLEVLSQVCDAIAYAHDRGILHRDLKPENVMLGEFGEVYVVDWGIAASLEQVEQNERIPSLDEVTTRVGTPAYMAPEMIEGEAGTIDERSDVYLLGGILHAILTGEPPHSGTTMIKVLADIREKGRAELPDDAPGRLAEICHRALAPDPRERFESVEAFNREIRDYLRHRESTAMSEEARRRLERLEAELAGEDPPEDLREEFAACRFGFEQALELSPRNQSAKEGLQELIELMIERELEREEYRAASNYLADLPEPRPDLRERVEQLGKRLRNREEELEELQEFRRESDVEIGRHARSLFVLVVGGLTVGLNLTPILWEWVTGAAPPVGVHVSAFAVYAAGVGALIYRARRALIQNAANRKMILSFLAVLGADGLMRLLQLMQTAPRAITAAHKAVLLGAAFTVLGIALDLRLLWMSITFLTVAPLQTMFPAYVMEIATLGVATGTGLLAWAWWPEPDNPAE